MKNEINDKLYYYFNKHFVDNIIKYKVRKIYKLDCSPILLDKYIIYSFNIIKGINELYFHNNYNNDYIIKFLLSSNNNDNLNEINCFNLLLYSAIFYEKEN